MPPKKAESALNIQLNLLGIIINFMDQPTLEVHDGDYKLDYFQTRLQLLYCLWDEFLIRTRI